MRIGPYEVKARLGRGGMGDVFLARHETSGALVALKRAREIDAGQIASLRREIYALSRLRHPGIVRLVDHGTADGLPWCALEFVEGETMHTMLEPHLTGPARPPTPTTATLAAVVTAAAAAPTMPPSAPLPYLGGPRAAVLPAPPPPYVVARCLATVQRLCEPLGFLHGEGIVHCDLKPANVVLRPDGTPVIIDFGLMMHFSGPHGRERLDESYAPIGTVEYMAPERIRGELVDARADLYAIGCILYEILTGRTPFEGEPRAIMRQHLAARPEPPSRHAPGVSPELDELVLRLLEKDPRARLGYADGVAAALEAAGAAGPPSSWGAVPRARAYLYRPTFAGHAATIRGIVTEPGGLVLVGAESGAGKTRLAMEVGRALSGEMRVVTGECLPLGTEGAAVLGAPLHPFLPLLRMIADECRSQGPGMTEILLGRRGRVLADYEPTLLDLPEVAEQPPPARLSPEAAQQRLRDDLAETLFAFAMCQRIVLILDDLQWADELTLGFLLSLSPERLADRGVLVVGTYRKDEAGDALFRLASRPGVRRVDLARLDRAAVASIARDMLALADVPEPLVDWLAASSSGNPFFVAEHLRSVVEQGLLARDAHGRWGAGPSLGSADLTRLPVPRTVRELLELRLDALSAGAREWTFAAAVLGREVDREVLERVARPVDLGAIGALTPPAPPPGRAAPSPGDEAANKARRGALEQVRPELDTGGLAPPVPPRTEKSGAKAAPAPTRAERAPGQSSPGERSAVRDTPVRDTPGGARGRDTPGGGARGRDTPVRDTPGGGVPAPAARPGMQGHGEPTQRIPVAALLAGLDAEPAPSTGRSRLASVEELLARQILQELPTGFRFVHDMLREVAYERIPPRRRKALHLAAAVAIEEVWSARGQLASAYASLAHHYGAADVTDKALFYLERAAESALTSGAYEQARAFLTRLLALDRTLGRAAPPLVRARWNRWLGEAAYALGDLAGLSEHIEQGLAELGRPLPDTPLAWGTAFVFGLARQAATFVGKRLAARLGAPPASAGAPAAPAADSAPSAGSTTAWRDGASAAPDGDSARPPLDSAIARTTPGRESAASPGASAVGSPGSESPASPGSESPASSPCGESAAAQAISDPDRERHAETAQMAAALAFRYFFAGDAAALIATSLLAVNEAEAASAGAAPSAGAPRGLSRPYAYLGYLTGLARLHPVARTYFRSAAEAGRAADDPDGVAYALTTEAVYRMCLCQWRDAEAAAEEALAIQLANANAVEAEMLHTILGNVEYFTGRFAASRRRFEALHDTARRRGNEQRRAWGLYAMARCDLAEGRVDVALRLLREAEALLATLSEEASELVVDGLVASALVEVGDLEGAVVRADRIARRIDRAHVPTVFSTVHAYVALAEVRLLLWARSGARVSLPALRANAYLAAFAAMFPLARPASQRCAAQARLLLGQRRAAERGFARSAETARRLGMPHEERLARRALEHVARG